MADTIKCGLYDYFEIACMRRSQVSLELHSGDLIAGIATNLETKMGKELLLLEIDGGIHQVNLIDIDVLVFTKSGERISIS